MKPTLLGADAIRRALAIRDLSDPARGSHAMQLALERIVDALRTKWRCPAEVHRASPVVSARDNYDRLHYPSDAVARDARYTRYVATDRLLRSHTTAMIPPLLGEIAADATPASDRLLVCPGLCYRRDCIDRLHTGEPHQLDLWRIRRGARLGVGDLEEMARCVARAAAPEAALRLNATSHPYTTDGLELEIRIGARWIEIGECGLALPALLHEAGLDPAHWSGLAMGLGLDRLVMILKQMDDVRLLRSTDPRIASQMLDLAPYRPVSTQPAATRDVSIAVAADTTPEELGDRVREALGEEAATVETVAVRSETHHDALPAAARERLGMVPGQKNILLRIVLRDLGRSLQAEEANVLRDRIYAALHEGTVHHWAARRPNLD